MRENSFSFELFLPDVRLLLDKERQQRPFIHNEILSQIVRHHFYGAE